MKNYTYEDNLNDCSEAMRLENSGVSSSKFRWWGEKMKREEKKLNVKKRKKIKERKGKKKHVNLEFYTHWTSFRNECKVDFKVNKKHETNGAGLHFSTRNAKGNFSNCMELILDGNLDSKDQRKRLLETGRMNIKSWI